MKDKKNKKINKKVLIFAIVVVVLIILIIIGVISLNNKNRNIPLDYEDELTFKLDSENKYIVHTDSRWTTMDNDGGSNTDIYYQIDLDNKRIKKVETIMESPKSNEEEGKSSTKLVYSKYLDYGLSVTLNNLLKDLVNNEELNGDKFEFYTVENLDVKRNVTYSANINALRTLLAEADKLDDEQSINLLLNNSDTYAIYKVSSVPVDFCRTSRFYEINFATNFERIAGRCYAKDSEGVPRAESGSVEYKTLSSDRAREIKTIIDNTSSTSKENDNSTYYVAVSRDEMKIISKIDDVQRINDLLLRKED